MTQLPLQMYMTQPSCNLYISALSNSKDYVAMPDTVFKSILAASLCFMALFMPGRELLAEPHEVSTDSTIAYPQRLQARSGWEKAAYLPGAAVYLPFHLVLSGVSKGVGSVYHSHLVQRLSDILTSESELQGMRPVYSSRAGAGGTFYRDRLIFRSTTAPPDRLDLKATLGIHDRWLLNTKWRSAVPYLREGYFEIKGEVFHFPDERFYGLGALSDSEDETVYGLNRVAFTTTILEKRFRDEEFSLQAGWETNWIDATPAAAADNRPATTHEYTEPNLPGVATRVELVNIGLAYLRDTRDHLGKPGRGGVSQLSVAGFSDPTTAIYGFYRSTIDLAHYYDLKYNRVFVLRGAIETNRVFSQGLSIPFYHLAEIGEVNTVRGYPRNRFRGHDHLLGTVEYRFPLRDIWGESGLDFVVFTDAGQISHQESFGDIRWDRTILGIGGGFRLWTAHGVAARLELARGQDMWRLYLLLNPADRW